MEPVKTIEEKRPVKKTQESVKVFLMISCTLAFPTLIGLAMDRTFLYDSVHFNLGTIIGIVVGWLLVATYHEVKLYGEK